MFRFSLTLNKFARLQLVTWSPQDSRTVNVVRTKYVLETVNVALACLFAISDTWKILAAPSDIWQLLQRGFSKQNCDLAINKSLVVWNYSDMT